MIAIQSFAFAVLAGLILVSGDMAAPASAQSSPQAVPQNGQLAVKDPWARATPGDSAPGVAYLTILSPAADRLTGLSSPVAQKAELHEMSMKGTVMQMRPVDALDIPAGQPIVLKPGGYHIMLMGLVHPLHEGQSFPLTLTFAKAGTREVMVPVEKLGAMGPPANPAAPAAR